MLIVESDRSPSAASPSPIYKLIIHKYLLNRSCSFLLHSGNSTDSLQNEIKNQKSPSNNKKQ